MLSEAQWDQHYDLRFSLALQRAVIVCDGDTLSIGDRWLAAVAPATADAPATSASAAPKASQPSTLASQTKEAIESALAASRGRVAGPFGAAARLGIPSTTLEARRRESAGQRCRGGG
ncbi:MAG TPA: hypothetical protein VKE51_41715 [Vicinamibacterales bacterium]|nr:hypothetical protein [Vicinamibacterales bacterium]